MTEISNKFSIPKCGDFDVDNLGIRDPGTGNPVVMKQWKPAYRASFR